MRLSYWDGGIRDTSTLCGRVCTCPLLRGVRVFSRRHRGASLLSHTSILRRRHALGMTQQAVGCRGGKALIRIAGLLAYATRPEDAALLCSHSLPTPQANV